MSDKSNKNDIKYNNATVASYLSVADKGAAKKYVSICNKISYMKDSLTRIGHGPYGERYWKEIFGESFEDFEKAIKKVTVSGVREISRLGKIIEKNDANIDEWTSFAKKLYDLRLYEWNKSYGDINDHEILWDGQFGTPPSNWRLIIALSYSNDQIIEFFGYENYPHNWKEFVKIIKEAKDTRACAGNDCPSNIVIDDESILSKREYLLVYSKYRYSLRYIYSKHIKLKPGFNGKITLKFTIAANGEINSIEIIKSTTSYPEFDNEIKNKVSTWKWKPIEKGSVTVSADFYFTE